MNDNLNKRKDIWIWIGGVLAVLALIGILGTKAVNNQDQLATSTTNAMSRTFTEAVFKTNMGDITVELLADKAPQTVANFIKLSDEKFYDSTKFHRVIKDFMIQGGDPNSKGDDRSLYGRGGPGYSFADEISDVPLERGVLAMANSGPNTNGSQFFIITAAKTPWLQGKHTAFGKVIAGMDIVDKIGVVQTDQNDVPEQPVIVETVVLK
jgi:cyclophilin family peptidyl-prolyl cis-trans isomerase